MKNIVRSFQKAGGLAVSTVLAFFLISCSNGVQELKDYDISAIYGYTFYGNITASNGDTLKPSLILYGNERADWNMSVNGMNVNQFYYYVVKNSASNYTLYWFGGSDYGAMLTKDKSKAAMTVQIGINSPDEIVILLTGDGLTGIGAMQGVRVPMTKQTAIPKNTDAPAIAFDPSIQDITIEVPGGAADADWDGSASYTGTFDYLVGPEGKLARGHGTCGKDSNGNEITPAIGINKNAPGSHTVTLKVHRFAYTQQMTIEGFSLSGVKVFKAGNVSYLTFAAPSLTAKRADGSNITLKDVTAHGKLENGKLTLRVSFKPGAMPFPIVEVFKSN
ncbi:MAG: calycin-like domain-containing protein [Treponema sp.]